jgi:hypothetical protein
MPLKRVIDFENVTKVLSSLSSGPRETQELVMSVVRMKVPLLYKNRATASRKPTVTTWNPVNQATVRKKPTVTT